MDPVFRQKLKAYHEEMLALGSPEHLIPLSVTQFNAHYPVPRDWAIGPFRRDERLVFKKGRQWDDPTHIGWTSSSIFNPTVIEADGRLALIYRAAPHKEIPGCRIGVAFSRDGMQWEDFEHNPIVYPLSEEELCGCEDPKIYRHEGIYYLFYNTARRVTEAERNSVSGNGYPIGEHLVDIRLATSRDLKHWEFRGIVVPREISKFWAKGAVIPRDPKGNAVRINGKFLMFLSEGCGGQQYIGYSDDMLAWEFRPHTYLPLPSEMGHVAEVACCITGHEPTGRRLILDFFHVLPDGSFAGSQALYDTGRLDTWIELNNGATLSWGGLIQWQGHWLHAQGWDAKLGVEEIYFYTAPVD